ncbi:MAG: hypothetical protein HXY46_15010 [Syntrophaceae bacterium]|nr:hypothetical protein [Syntrophaceae bacterium]
MKTGIRVKRIPGILVAIGLTLGLLSACATTAPEKVPTVVPTGQGTVVFLEKYEFKPPPQGWIMMKNLEGGDFELGFMRFEKGDFPSQTTFIYDDQPYGSSQDLEKRSDYYCTKFLFNSGIDLEIKKRERLTINGREALAIYMEGQNQITKEKAKSKVYLVKKGSRIISFVCTQWRPLSASFSQEPFDHFEAFVRSFKFVKKDFYESFEEELKKIGL